MKAELGNYVWLKSQKSWLNMDQVVLVQIIDQVGDWKSITIEVSNNPEEIKLCGDDATKVLYWIGSTMASHASGQKSRAAKPDPAQQDGQPVKRGRGRPRKHPLSDQLPPSALAAFETAVPAPKGAEPPEEHETDYKHDEIA